MATAEQIDQDLRSALKARDSVRVATLRLLKAAAKNAEVAKRGPLDEGEYRDVIVRQAKLRREAADEYERAGRSDRASQERDELAILQEYLPQPLSEEEIRAAVQRAIAQTGAASQRDLGKVMSRVMAEVRGRADGSSVQAVARELLAGQAS